MRVLVTGGAGYIGSHTAIVLALAGHELTLLDNLSNSSLGVVAAVRELAGRDIAFEQGDIADARFLNAVFAQSRFDAVIHFAALKAVAESTTDPLRYYRNNVAGSACLLEQMAAHGVTTMVFSSSATVYGDARGAPITEQCALAPTNPYGRTKLVVENMLRDLRAADATWRISILRYFNPIGAHPSGLVGEAPQDVPNNLLPYVAQVAAGQREQLQVFGDDYPTPDGTCIRDYVHVMDLAHGHLKALEHLAEKPRLAVHNLGTGRGHSVLEVVRAFEVACGKPIPCRVADRRPGDVPVSFADASRASAELGWSAEHDLARMCEHTWRWQATHPNGYDEP